MPTNTARLGLIKPATSGEAVDVSQLNTNADTIDQHIGFRQVTSGTRPATPFRGLMIEETDTGKLLWWNGVTWKAIKEDSGWVVPTLASSWDNNNSLNSRLLDGIVHLRGIIRHDSGSKTGPSIDVAVATLAVGHRPATTMRFNAIKWVSGAGTTEFMPEAVVTIKTDGTIDAHHLLATAYTGIICDGIRYPVG